MRAYAIRNPMGFCNTSDVLVFESAKTRDNYVARGMRGDETILRSEATRYAEGNDKPTPFSGEYWGIDTDSFFMDDIDGLIGRLVVTNPLNRDLERFYK